MTEVTFVPVPDATGNPLPFKLVFDVKCLTCESESTIVLRSTNSEYTQPVRFCPCCESRQITIEQRYVGRRVGNSIKTRKYVLSEADTALWRADRRNMIPAALNYYEGMRGEIITEVISFDGEVLTTLGANEPTELPKGVGVHVTHCCLDHGCKYGDDDCPVEKGLYPQCYPCETCSYGSRG